MNPDPRFDPNYKGPIQMHAVIGNPSQTRALTIMSGEFEHLNGKVLSPGQQMNISLLIPEGFREYLKEERILGKDILYVGLRDKDAADPLFHTPNIS